MHVGSDEAREQLINEYLDEINEINQEIEKEKQSSGSKQSTPANCGIFPARSAMAERAGHGGQFG